MIRKLHMKESIYTDNGYRNRNDYLKSLADEFNVPLSTVKDLSNILGADEDFDGLVLELDNMTYGDYDKDENENIEWFDYMINYIGNNRYGLFIFDSKSDYIKSKDDVIKRTDISAKGYNNINELNEQVAYALASYDCFIETVDGQTCKSRFFDSKKIDWKRIKDNTKRNGYPYATDEIYSNEDYIDPEVVGNKCAEINIDDILYLAEL